MDTLQAIFTRRSVRAFTPEPLPTELLRQVLEAGAASASGGNVQPWGFVLAQSPERVAALRSLAPGIIGRPTAVVVICLDAGRAERLGNTGGERLAWLDVGLATQNMLLAAHSLGIGDCPIGSFHREGVALFFDLPAGVVPILLLALGFPEAPPASPGRRPMADVCFLERWGRPYA